MSTITARSASSYRTIYSRQAPGGTTLPKEVLEAVETWIRQKWCPAIQGLAELMKRMEKVGKGAGVLEKINQSLDSCLKAYSEKDLPSAWIKMENPVSHLVDIRRCKLYNWSGGKKHRGETLLGSIRNDGYKLSAKNAEIKGKKDAVTGAFESLIRLLRSSKILSKAVDRLLQEKDQINSDGSALTDPIIRGETSASSGKNSHGAASDAETFSQNPPDGRRTIYSGFDSVGQEDWGVIARWLQNTFRPAALDILAHLPQFTSDQSSSFKSPEDMENTMKHFLETASSTTTIPLVEELSELAEFVNALYPYMGLPVPDELRAVPDNTAQFGKLAEFIDERLQQERSQKERNGWPQPDLTNEAITNDTTNSVLKLYKAFVSFESSQALTTLAKYRRGCTQG